MSEVKVLIDPIGYQAAKEAFELFKYGEVIRKEWILKAFRMTDFKEGTRAELDAFMFDFMQNMEDFKYSLLVDYKMALDNQRGVGYLIVAPSQQVELAMNRLKATIRKETKKSIDILTHINDKLLDHNDIKRRDESLGKIAQLTAFSRKQLRLTS